MLTGREIVDSMKEQIATTWKDLRDRGLEDLAAFLICDASSVQIAFSHREDLLQSLTKIGIDLAPYQELRVPANKDNPIPSIALWVIVGLEDNGKPTLYVTKFLEPLSWLGRIGVA